MGNWVISMLFIQFHCYFHLNLTIRWVNNYCRYLNYESFGFAFVNFLSSSSYNDEMQFPFRWLICLIMYRNYRNWISERHICSWHKNFSIFYRREIIHKHYLSFLGGTTFNGLFSDVMMMIMISCSEKMLLQFTLIYVRSEMRSRNHLWVHDFNKIK